MRLVIGTEKVSSTVTEKMKSLKLLERLRNLNITYSDVERLENDQRMRKDFCVISRGAEELQGICQWNEDDSWRRLTAG